MLHTGLYAVQIAWWLAFFPPERFLILTSSELRDPTSAVQVCTTTEYLDQRMVEFLQLWLHFMFPLLCEASDWGAYSEQTE